MVHFGQLRSMDINEGVAACAGAPGACLVDVRDEQDYLKGHVPGSRNVPIAQLDTLVMMYPLETHVYVCGETSDRASNAAKRIRLMQFAEVVDLGSVESYTGPME